VIWCGRVRERVWKCGGAGCEWAQECVKSVAGCGWDGQELAGGGAGLVAGMSAGRWPGGGRTCWTCVWVVFGRCWVGL